MEENTNNQNNTNIPENSPENTDAAETDSLQENEKMTEKVCEGAQAAENIREDIQATEKVREDADGSQTEKKGRFGRTIRGMVSSIGETFKDYPVTLFAIMFAALIGALDINDRIFPDRFDDSIMRIIVFCLILAFQVLLYEEIFMEKPVIRWIGYILSSAISAVFVFIISSEDKLIFGIEKDAVSEVTYKILIFYGIVMVGISVYHIFRRLEDDFEEYLTKAFFALIKAAVVYGLFAAGLAIIVFIFNELIFDTDAFLAQIELFLAGGIYTAMCLKAVSGKNEEPGKFARACIYYVLQPMLIIAFAIIYAYIIKIFVTDTVPSNRVFGILTFLFALGLPIWTMMHGMSDGKTRRFTRILPFVYVPFIGLQAWSIGIRIKAYGFTPERYFAVVFMIVEVLYFILYVVRLTGVKQSVSWILFVFMILAPLVLFAPRISCEDVVIASQIGRMEQILSKEETGTSEKSALKSAYSVISDAGYKGDIELKKHFTVRQLAEIAEYDVYNMDMGSTLFVGTKDDTDPIDVSGYSRMYKICSLKRDEGYLYRIYYYDDHGSIGEPDRAVDLGDLLKAVYKDCEEKDEDLYEYDLNGRRIYKVSENMDLYIQDMNLTYDTVLKEVEDDDSLHIDGYILER